MTGSETGRHRLSRHFRDFGEHWIRGALAVMVALAVWYFLSNALPDLKDGFANSGSAVTFVVGLIVVPMLVGWFGHRVLNPLVRKWESAGGWLRWEERLVTELAADEQRGFLVVLVPFPSQEIRTLGLVTNTFPGPNGEGELATVFLPHLAPKPGTGALRIVPAASLEPTNWRFKDLIQFHVSYGSSSPITLTEGAPATDELRTGA